MLGPKLFLLFYILSDVDKIFGVLHPVVFWKFSAVLTSIFLGIYSTGPRPKIPSVIKFHKIRTMVVRHRTV